MPTNTESTCSLMGMTLLDHSHSSKAFYYRDDADGSVWQADPKKGYGELVPFYRHASDYAQFRQAKPQDALNLIGSDCEKFTPKGARPDGTIRQCSASDDPRRGAGRPQEALYLIDPHRESFTLNGTRPNGMIWRHDPDEQGYIFVCWWPRHLVRRLRFVGEPMPDIENGRRVLVDIRDDRATF